jgi:predicted acylesterase/phospholipase RssA
MTIKHLVISGGGPIMIQILGTLQHLENNNIININDIESLYGTSAGAIVGVLICLKFDWATINDYIIKRPWHDVFTINPQSIFDSYSKKGIFDIKIIEKCFKPLFDAKDINIDISLQDFYNLTKIELHVYSFEINKYELHDISYITHPKLSLMKAIQMTCGLPILFTPVCIEDKCFIDGGMACNYPLNYCISSGKKSGEIFGFKNKYSSEKININNESTLFDFILNLLFKALTSVSTDHIQPNIKNEIVLDTEYLTIDILKNSLSDIDIRRELLNNGTQMAIKFLHDLKCGI